MRHDTPDESKNRKYWKRDREAAEQRLAGLGGQLMDSPHAYEMWRWMHPDVTLIFYPHRTSANNYHCRVRAGHCTNRETLRKAIYALAENTCTFQFPTERKWHNDGVMASIQRERAAIEAKATKRTCGVMVDAPAAKERRDVLNRCGNCRVSGKLCDGTCVAPRPEGLTDAQYIADLEYEVRRMGLLLAEATRGVTPSHGGQQ